MSTHQRKEIFYLMFALSVVATSLYLSHRACESLPDEVTGSPFGERGVRYSAFAKRDDDGLTFSSGRHSRSRIRIALAVGTIENRTGSGTPIDADRSFAGPGSSDRLPLATFERLVRQALERTSLFELVESTQARPSSFEETGLVSRDGISTPAIAENPQAEYQLLASVDEWTPSTAESTQDLEQTISTQVELGMTLRVVDTQTGQVLFATAERTATTEANGATDTFGHTPDLGGTRLLQAAQTCIQTAAARLAHWFGDRPWIGVVAAVEGDRAYINAGSHRGLEVGMVLDVLASDQRLLDPETGLFLGSVTARIGQLRIIDVQKHVSLTAIVEGCEDLKPGARVRFRRDAP